LQPLPVQQICTERLIYVIAMLIQMHGKKGLNGDGRRLRWFLVPLLPKPQEVHDQTKLLITNPAMGRPGRVTGTRELVVAHFPYVIPYRLRGEEIQILRIFNTNQKPPIAW